MTSILLTGVCIVYFVIQVQLLYPLTLSIYTWSTGNLAPFLSEPTFSQYSSSHCAIILFVILCIICSKKDMSFFMKAGSIGVIFIFMLTFFIMYTGFAALSNTEFMIGSTAASKETDWEKPIRTLTLISPNIGPLAGIFGLGYFLHPVSLPIVRSAARPENNDRDIFLGYLFVFISYILLGTLGYIGFIGFDFASYFEGKEGTATDGQINQNCLSMFSYTEVPAFILRLAIFLLIFSGYPLVHFFLTQGLIKLIFGEGERKNVSRLTELCFGWLIIVFGLLFALFYPNIGLVLSYVGAVCGFVIVYLLPVMVDIAQSREEIQLKLRG